MIDPLYGLAAAGALMIALGLLMRLGATDSLMLLQILTEKLDGRHQR